MHRFRLSPGEARTVLERSIAMTGAQRGGALVLLVALILCTPRLGSHAIVPIVIGFVAFVAIKRPSVQMRIGLWSSVGAWASAEAALFVTALLANGPPEYLVPLLAVPTVLATPVWPVRVIPLTAGFTSSLMLLVGLLADRERFLDSPRRMCTRPR